ncbi:MAG: hypothetical protein ABW168_15640 [Sedimenticola sp.]
MPEISQPTPVKPVWPSRPDKDKQGRKQEKDKEASEKPDQEKDSRHHNGRPKIDEYV